MQTIKMGNLQGLKQVPGKNGGQAWRKAGPRSSEGRVEMEGPQNGHTTPELPGGFPIFSVSS